MAKARKILNAQRFLHRAETKTGHTTLLFGGNSEVPATEDDASVIEGEVVNSASHQSSADITFVSSEVQIVGEEGASAETQVSDFEVEAAEVVVIPKKTVVLEDSSATASSEAQKSAGELLQGPKTDRSALIATSSGKVEPSKIEEEDADKSTGSALPSHSLVLSIRCRVRYSTRSLSVTSKWRCNVCCPTASVLR